MLANNEIGTIQPITDIGNLLKSYGILFQAELKMSISDIKFNGETAERLPGILSITFPDASGESVMHLLDLKGICVSTGSACYSGKDEPSHVLLAIGLTEQQAKSSIRISYGRYNTKEDVKIIASALCGVCEKIATTKMAGREQ